MRKNNQSLIYLASPYSHKNKLIKRYRKYMVDKCYAELTLKGYVVIPPITLNAGLTYHIPQTDWLFWKNVDECILDHCDELWIALIDGWKKSIGVRAEIKYALKNGIPIRYVNVIPKVKIQRITNTRLFKDLQITSVEDLND